MEAPLKPLSKALLLWLVTMLILRGLMGLSGTILQDYLGALSAMSLFYVPVLFFSPKIWQKFIAHDRFIKACQTGLLVSLLVLAFCWLVQDYFQIHFLHHQFRGLKSEIWGAYILQQFVLVALPEEFFFRGFLLNAFEKRYPANWRLHGQIFWGKADIFVSLLFAFSHALIVQFQFWHLLIFFPSLLFHYLQKCTQTIWASTICHAMCNIFSYAVYIGYN